jgi:hypothetical protein
MGEAAVTPSIDRRREPADSIFRGPLLSRALRQTVSALAVTAGLIHLVTAADQSPQNLVDLGRGGVFASIEILFGIVILFRPSAVGAGPFRVRRLAVVTATVLAVAALGPLPPAMLGPVAAGGPELASAQTGGFIEQFTGAPSVPTPFSSPNWDIHGHDINPAHWNSLDPMTAEHGDDCAPPPATHALSGVYANAVFQCRDHIMTGINGQDGGYAALYLTPNQMVDFSGDEAVIRFDVSTLRRSDRDWIDLWITPFADNLMAPLEPWLPDLDGRPRRAIHTRMDMTNSYQTYFRTEVVCLTTGCSSGGLDASGAQGYESFLTPSATARETFELHISRTHFRVGMPAYNQWWTDTDMPDIGWSQGILQIGHHSYAPMKGACLRAAAARIPGTGTTSASHHPFHSRC